ncbi:MAG: hypothetical protein H6667_12555 [Ardenticatenaceae bacterium]|nr:hypothetical protein [Ardenticatenaceae bacterium]
MSTSSGDDAKFAVLIAYSTKSAHWLPGRSRHRRLCPVCCSLGLAFQVIDDILHLGTKC